MHKLLAEANPSLRLRSISDHDNDFLQKLYGSTRAAEMEMVPWTNQEKIDFIAMQYNAQHSFYKQQFPDAEFSIVSNKKADIGRLYTDVRADDLRIIDIALLPDYQRKGIGSRLLGGVVQNAAERDLPVTIHVEKNNPAMSLYEQLDFELVEDQSVYHLMRWQPNS